MKQKYIIRQGLMIFNQLLLLILLCILNVLGAAIHTENIVHIILLTLLFWDGYYISSKNVKGNPVLSQFVLLLLLFGWYFSLSLFSSYAPADTASVVILPVCLYQLVNFRRFFFSRRQLQGEESFSNRVNYSLPCSHYQLFIDKDYFYIII